jgi:hypothetical protein
MDDLDLLKKDWQKSDTFTQVSEQDIYGMLHKKSSSIVRWLLIISVLEFGLWTALSFVFDSSKHFKDEHQLFYVDLIEYFGYGIILIFIYFLFKNYKKITTTVTTKQLMIDILKTKKIVQYYVWYNLTMIVLAIFIGVVYLFILNPKNEILKQKFLDDPKLLFGFIVTIIGITIIFLGVFWLFYKLLYGILLKKLYVNYEELKKIDL